MLVWAVWLLPGALGLYLEEPVATTSLGRVRGYRSESRAGRVFLAFSGLPYARPPLGKLRFQPPSPALPWLGTRLATVDGPYCIQLNTFEVQPYPEGEEDCLYLSLYTHNLTGQAPVLVHFHGGGFISGNGARKTGPQYLMDEDIVLVNVNYRVGLYGFLSFEDDIMPGNQGLKDQVMALRWIKENIACFGGDPSQVTIMGESAGAISVFHHIISPLSKGLFHRAIAESGTSYNTWAVAPPGYAKNQTMRLLEYVECNYCPTTEEAVACLASKDPKEIITKLELFRVWQIDPLAVVGPVFERDVPGAFLVGPRKKWKHNPVPVLMGATSAEGLLRTLYFIDYNVDYKWFSYHFSAVAPLSLGYFFLPETDEITDAIRQYYFPNKEITRNDWVNITTMYTDALFLKGILDGANKHPGKVYFYYFDYVGEKSFAGNFPDRNDSLVFGAYHTDELIYLWNINNYGDLHYEDLHISQDLISLWINFVKYGTPTPRGLQWDEWTPAKNRYLHISKEGFKMEEGLAKERYQFWSEIEKMLPSSSVDSYHLIKPPQRSPFPALTSTTQYGSYHNSKIPV